MLGLILGGRYRVLRVLGAGSFGHTYLAVDSHRPDSPQCVVKHLRPNVTDANFWPVARELFAKEAHVLETLGTHDQIPRLLAYFEQDENFYLVQEYLPGMLLSQSLKPGVVWPLEKVQRLLQDILSVLVFVHDRGVIHRDIKPSNLIERQQDGKFVLIDFGAVKSIQVLCQGQTATASSTAAFTIGTPGYMPPEQSQGRPCAGSDLYALGMVAIQALTGQMPGNLQFNARGEWDWQSLVKAPLSSGFAEYLQKMVAYSPRDRFATARDALKTLQRVIAPNRWQRVLQVMQTPVQDLLPRRRTSSIGLETPTRGLLSAPVPPQSSNPTGQAGTGSQLESDRAEAELPTSNPNSAGSHRTAIFISFRPVTVETTVAQALDRALQTSGFRVFHSAQTAENPSLDQLHARSVLQRCRVFVLLLSPQSVNSELLLEELRTIRHLTEGRSLPQPMILPIRIDLPFTTPLNYELRGYLQRLQQRIWNSTAAVEPLVREIVERIQAGISPEPDLTDETPSSGLPTIPPITLQSDAPPVPVAEPELPEGQLRVASVFYIERPPIEQQCSDTIQQPGALIRIKAPRQMGKTSLMARTLYEATAKGYQTVALNLQLTDRKVLGDLNQLLRWLCASVSRRLQMPNRVQLHWDELFGSKYNCTAYFEEHLLPHLRSPLILALDEVDRVFAHPDVASDFFGLLRAWHEEAKNQVLWHNLRLIVVHATEVYIPLNLQQSPFNVGLPIELQEFNAEQVQVLVQRHGLKFSDRQIEQLMALIGGHPYLTRLALYHIAQSGLTLEQLLETAPTETGLFRDHLAGQTWVLRQHPELAAALDKVVNATDPVALDAELGFKLHSLGLITLQGDRAQIRYQLYRRYFEARLSAPSIRTNITDA